MVLSDILQRRVRAAKVEYELEESDEEGSLHEISESASHRHVDGPNDGENSSTVEDDFEQSSRIEARDESGDDVSDEHASAGSRDHDDDGGDSDNASASPEPDARDLLSSISFGALASAQASMPRKRKRGHGGHEEEEVAQRERSPSPFHEAEERRAGRKKGLPAPGGRSSKHAPAELSSKKAVSRRRQVVSVPKVQARDPRFSSLSGTLNPNRVQQNYAFLNNYRASEIAELKEQVRATKDAGAKEALKRQVKSMEDRERARKRVEEEKAVVRDHRRREQEMVKQGKKPFFLKQGDIKKQVLVKRYEALGEKKAEKAMERKRKKKTMRERKAMPSARREA